jgi:CubicO group peptidase (beta-lactamase class C family)
LTYQSRISSALAIPLMMLAIGCQAPDAPTGPEAAPPTGVTPADPVAAFRWGSSTPESHGMCGSTIQLGCTKTLQQIWNDISNPKHNTKRFVVVRNDRVIFDRGGTSAYAVYSASKGLLGAPTLVYAMSKCGVGLSDPASRWLQHGDGVRWGTDYPWDAITVEHLATHTSGICDYGNSSSVCRNENPGWHTAFDRAKGGGPNYVYPKDAFTIARAQAEQNREPPLGPGSVLEYSNVAHALMNYVVQKACGQKLTDIFDLYIKQSGMGSAVGPALITTDDAQQFNQSAGIARWNGLHGAAVLRLAGRRGIWDNRNVEPVKHWHAVTKITGNLPAAAAEGWGVVYENNSKDMWTQTPGHKRLSLETFGHGGKYSTVFLNDPLTSTIIVRQGENNANGASYLTLNGCQPGWTGTAPTCAAGTNWSNNWNVSSGTPGFPYVAPRKKVVEPLQQAFFFPPPFCRMTVAAGTPVDSTTDVYGSPAGAATIDLAAEIQVNPREGAGSSVVDRVEFYKETDAAAAVWVGRGTLVAGTSPRQYRFSYPADSHGAVAEARTYFANCVARSTQDGTKKIPSHSRPVRVRRM